MDYDYIDAVEKRFNDLYSYGGKVERSFFQNVGKIVNKEAFTKRGDEVAEEAFKNIEEIMSGDYRRKK